MATRKMPKTTPLHGTVDPHLRAVLGQRRGQSCTFVPASAGCVNARHRSAGKVPPNTGPPLYWRSIGTRIVGNPFQTAVVSVGVMPRTKASTKSSVVPSCGGRAREAEISLAVSDAHHAAQHRDRGERALLRDHALALRLVGSMMWPVVSSTRRIAIGVSVGSGTSPGPGLRTGSEPVSARPDSRAWSRRAHLDGVQQWRRPERDRGIRRRPDLAMPSGARRGGSARCRCAGRAGRRRCCPRTSSPS